MASFAVDNAPNSGGNATHARTLDPSIIPGSSFDTGVEFTSEAMPPECRAMYADRSTEHTMMVRGPTYLDDKAKIFGGEAMAKLLCMDVFEVTSGDRHDHLACRGAAKRRLNALRTLPDDLFFLIVNHQIPGTPPVSLAAYFALPLNLQERHPEPETAAFMRLFAKFIDAPRGEEARLAAWGLAPASSSASAEPATPGAGGDDGDGDDEGGNGSGCSTPADPASPGVKKGLFGLLSRGAQRLREIRDVTWPTASDVGTLPPTDFRNARFKLVPSISEGPWVAKSAVGSTPTLLGKKVVQRYFRGDDYLEIDIHVGSSVIASNIVGLCRGYAKQLVNDCAIVIQGESADELPERLLCCAQLRHIDLTLRRPLE